MKKKTVVGVPLSLVAACLALPPAAPAAAKAPSLTVDAIEVEPKTAKPGTLCKLRVKVKNDSDQDATYLVFAVKVAGSPLSVYDKHTWAYRVTAGQVTTVDLFNFWVPESGPRTVEVTLTEARWAKVTKDGDTTTSTPLGNVEGLPASQTLRLE